MQNLYVFWKMQILIDLKLYFPLISSNSQIHVLWLWEIIFWTFELQHFCVNSDTTTQIFWSECVKQYFVLNYSHIKPYEAPWCSGWHYYRTSFNKSCTLVLCRFKSYSLRVGDLQWWQPVTMVSPRNKAKHLSSIKHSTKANHHNHHPYFLVVFLIYVDTNLNSLNVSNDMK